MTSQKPSPYQPPSQSEPSQSEPSQLDSNQPRETPKKSRPDHHVGSMYLASFVGALPLFALLLGVNAWWDGYGFLAYSKPIVEFVFLDAFVSVVVVGVLYSVKVRSNSAALGFGCLWPFLLVVGVCLFVVSVR